MKDLGITEGKILKYKKTSQHKTEKIVNDKGISICAINIGLDESESNAELIADCLITANKCGLLPSKLLEQRDEMLEMLQDILDTIRECETPRLYEIEQLIKKATK